MTDISPFHKNNDHLFTGKGGHCWQFDLKSV